VLYQPASGCAAVTMYAADQITQHTMVCVKQQECRGPPVQ
jgi:hypothetical protein